MTKTKKNVKYKNKIKNKTKNKNKNKIKNKTKNKNKTKHKNKNKNNEFNVVTFSYSPTINKKYKQTKYLKIANKTFITDNINNECDDEYTINIPNKYKQDIECLSYNDTRVIKYLLRLLLNQKRVNPKKIIAPKQITANCWFNSFFMCFFISDKGRKFTKSFRESCITGIIPNTNIKLNNDLYKYFWLLNKYINASIYGNDYASLMNTNNIIKKIYNYLKQYNLKYNPSNTSGGDAWVYFKIIISFLYEHYKNKNPYKFYNFIYTEFLNIEILLIHTKIHCFSLYYPKSNNKIKLKKQKKIIIYSKYENKHIEYVLDCMTIDDIGSEHQACMITLNNDDYFFDGEGFNTLNKHKWKNKLNIDENFKSSGGKINPSVAKETGGRKTLTFNHARSSQRLFYYRVTK